MKNSALFLILLFSVATSFATKNPHMRACYVAGGNFMVVNAPEDQIGLCVFGPAIVGSIDILNKDARIEVPLSLHNYKKGVKTCGFQNLTKLTTFEGEEIEVCQYYDGSVIDLETLATGKLDSRNSQLNSALGL